MANQLSGQTGASPRNNSDHPRYQHLGRTRHSQQFAAWLALQASAARLNTTTTIIYQKWIKYGADRVENATNLSQLP